MPSSVPPSSPPPGRLIPLAQLTGAAVGLVVFAVMLLRGMAAGNPPEVVLSRALAGLAIATAVGAVAGTLARRVMHEDDSAEPVEPSAAAAADAGRPTEPRATR